MKLITISIILFTFLFLRFFFFYQNPSHPKDGGYISFRTTLLSEPQVIGNYQRIYTTLDQKTKIFVFTSIYPEYHYGDVLIISGNLKYKVLSNGSHISSMNFPKIEAVKSSENYILAFISFIRQKIVLVYERSLPAKSASLLLGIVFGIKEAMPKEFSDNLKMTGVTHVIAASGMNVTLVGGFLSSILVFFVRRQIALFLSVIGILFYAVLSGLEPSIVRAAVMGIMAFSAQILGRQRIASYGLFVAGYSMLFILPSLLSDVGFQLSFISTLGLLYIRPLFERTDRAIKLLKSSIIGDETVTTISAQISTLPILLVNFGTYSLWSILTNVLVLWTIPILMILGGVGAILGIIIEPVGKLFLYLCLPLLIYFEIVINTFANYGGILKIENISWPIILGYYFILFSLVSVFKKK